MREQIILAPGAKGSELTKSLAMHGVNTFNMRICGAGELARLGMMRSGIAISEDFLSAREEAALVSEAVKGEAYFGKLTYSDICEIAGAIRRMRSLVPTGDEASQLSDTLAKGVFAEKNNALISVYRKYMKILSERRLIDSVTLVRRASEKCVPIDANFIELEEYPLTPLERALLNRLSGGNAKKRSLRELFGLTEGTLKIHSYKNCYGAANEVEAILADIYAGKNLDRCTVAVTDASIYGQLFFDYALLYDLPITFGCGVPIINANPAKLLVLYYNWIAGGLFGAAALSALLTSPAFDRKKMSELFPQREKHFSANTLTETLLGLRLTNDAAANAKRVEAFKKAVAEEEALLEDEEGKAFRAVRRKKLCIPYLEVYAKELALPPEEFLYKYSYIRSGGETNAQQLIWGLDLAAASAIYEELRIMQNAGLEQSTEDIIRNVLKLSVAATQSEEGKLFVTGIDGALTTVRENLFIAGLSASAYPGSPRENYLLLDSDLKLFGPDAEYLTSEGSIKRKRERLLTLARLNSDAGSAIEVSFAGMNVSELKRDNASSLVFELYRAENGAHATSKELEEKITKVDYFAPAISATREIGRCYNSGVMVVPDRSEEIREAIRVNFTLDREYSPSSLENYFGCRRKFMLGDILGIPQPEDDKPFEVISKKTIGLLAHSLMEQLANSDMSREAFLASAEQAFNRFLEQNPPLVPQSAEGEREQFLEIMGNAYDMDPHREVALKEEDIHCVHETGVKLHGFPDRVEKLEDGSYLIVDFKTARNLGHETDDINTCLQVVLYAYLMEQNGYRVSGAEYRYLRLGQTVTCVYNDEMKANLTAKLEEFKQGMEAADFPIAEDASADSETCKYCKFGMICGRNLEEGGDEDE